MRTFGITDEDGDFVEFIVSANEVTVNVNDEVACLDVYEISALSSFLASVAEEMFARDILKSFGGVE